MDMSTKTPSNWFETAVRARSYQVWEREGRKSGCEEECWSRAIKEIDVECRAAVEGKNARFAPPHVVISELPIRSVAGETASGAARYSAAA
jgi:hypothetical protein